jgi:preprotein translocase subunit SecA
VRRLFRVQLAEPPPLPRRRPAVMVTQHAEVGAFGGGGDGDGEGEGGGSAAAPRSAGTATAVARAPRSGPRAGRNDPCPCGSGKKYKKCHLPIDEGTDG